MRRELRLVQAVALPQEPLDAHAADSAAELLAGREADLALELLLARAHAEYIEHEMASGIGLSEAVDPLERGRALQHAAARKRPSRRFLRFLFQDSPSPAL